MTDAPPTREQLPAVVDRITLPDALRELRTLVRPLGGRPGYFGGGSKVHLFVGGPGHGWWCLCGGVPHNYQHPGRPDYTEADFRHAPDGARVDCWRCAKAAGQIDRYPGPEARREMEARSQLPRSRLIHLAERIDHYGSGGVRTLDIDARRDLQAIAADLREVAGA